MHKRYLLIAAVIFLLASLVHSAPAPRILVVNDKIKECKMFWAGDEFVYHELPSDWKPFNSTFLSRMDYYILTTDAEYRRILCDRLNYTYRESSNLSSTGDFQPFLFLNNQTRECRVFILDSIYSGAGMDEYENLTSQGWYKDLSEDEMEKISNYTGEYVLSRACSGIGYNYTGELKTPGVVTGLEFLSLLEEPICWSIMIIPVALALIIVGYLIFSRKR